MAEYKLPEYKIPEIKIAGKKVSQKEINELINNRIRDLAELDPHKTIQSSADLARANLVAAKLLHAALKPRQIDRR